MKHCKYLIIMVGVMICSCSSTSKFPVSGVLPGANIHAKVSDDDNENTKIQIKADHLANPNRLSPSKNVYVIWIITENDLVKNVGKIIQEESGKANLEVTTPFKVKEILITAEEAGNVTQPGDTLITSKKI